ncbi:MAG: HDIG domain-containing protein [Candidatus Omnitrophica bacterium]|nr:HDIG domain-containing protein [Candidatus Omnitrophota bacterium]MDD5078990.1 HDIG domain-containing protein [Candidatus Omnitrophota bacterium]
MKRQIAIDKLKFNSRVPRISEKLRGWIVFLAGSAAALVYSFFAGVNLLVAIFLICLVVYLKFIYRDLNSRPFNLFNLSLLFLMITSLGFLMINHGWPLFFIPFAAAPMLAAILFNEPVISLLLTIAPVIVINAASGQANSLGVIFFISGIISSLLVHGVRRRNTIVIAGFVAGCVQAVLFLMSRDFKWAYSEEALFFLLNGLVCGVIAQGILPVFEYLFGTITNIKLLELADFNSPLLNRLMLEAPGTYHHSLIVGNLSEAACKSVGANALLARIGAYYHDIGKLQKPEYFTENQGLKMSAHEALAPNMSKLLIMNHVKEGLDLARKYHLAPQLEKFIQQHHGTSLVYFFYRRALENSDMPEEVHEEGFRYPGPKPNTKETAIVLLADSVEAATRAVKDPTPSKIDELVHKIINNKFIDGQLDECDLTLKDLEIIATVFIHILSGIYHTRINYPEADGADIHKKPSKENTNQSEKDKRHRP